MTITTDRSDATFWRDQLSGNLPMLDLPIDHRRTAKASYQYGQVPFEIPAELARRLELLAHSQGVSLCSVYLAAHSILLSRYGNTQEVLIGFANRAVVRADCTPEQSFTALAHRIAATLAILHDHEAISLRQLARLLNIPPAPGRAPLCDAHFDWEAGVDKVETAEPLRAGYDIALEFQPDEDGFLPCLLYRNDLFDVAKIIRMASHFVALLQSIAENPEGAIAQLEMLPDDERALLLGPYAGRTAEYPRRTLHELFAEQAALRPDAEALVFGAERFSYRELDRRSNQVAQFLRRHGIRHEDRVGIFMARSANMIISILGTLKAGGAYVPIDPDYPAERLKFIAEDTQVHCVLTEHAVTAKLPTSAPLVYIDGPDSPIVTASEEPVPNISTPESIAVAIYTSGSTGKPKAASIPHRAAVRTVRNPDIVQATPEDRVSQVASPSFDAAILEIWAALTNGAALIGVRKEVLLDPSALTKLLRTERITILFVNTTYLHQIGRTAPEVFKGVRKVLFGGEAAEPGPIRNILRHVPPGVLVNLYGPAENTVASSAYEIFFAPEDATTIPIGRPIVNSRMYLLDKRMQLVPIGLQGEIYVGGDGLARGYWNRPELTAERFVLDPFSGHPGARLYRTGDLARMRENGEFEFLGRVDDQIKIRGHRIEVAEVREAIASHPAVKQVALLVREDQPGDRRLIAYVTLRHPLQSASDSLRLHVKQQLPAHMIPAAFVVLDSIPVNTNGKVDRKALPPPSSRAVGAGYSEPQTDLERMLAIVWQELLGVNRIGRHENFFDLGGHSLLAARLIARIEEETGQNIPVATLFEAPTIAELAQKLQDHSYTRAWAPLVELHARQSAAAAPPFFCIHSLGANLVSFHKLARLLRSDRAIYGLQPHGLDGQQQPMDTMDAMAAAYLEEIQRKQPHGPYYIGGICLGGVVAYEVARRLEASGEEVPLLALMDSFVPGQPGCIHHRSAIAEYVDFHLGELLLLSGTARLKYVAKWIGNAFIRLGWALGLRPRDSMARATRHVSSANLKALLGYTPRPYRGKITQLMCSDWAQRSYEDRRLAWCALAAGGLEIHIVPGNHLSMIEEPHVQVLAHQLQACLDRAGGLDPSLNRTMDLGNSQSLVQKPAQTEFSPMFPLSV